MTKVNSMSMQLTAPSRLFETASKKGGETQEMSVSGRLVVNDSAALVEAALDGVGIIYMINGYVERLVEQGRLVRVLTEWSPDLPGFTLYYSDRRRMSPKLRALIEFLREEQETARPPVELLDN